MAKTQPANPPKGTGKGAWAGSEFGQTGRIAGVKGAGVGKTVGAPKRVGRTVPKATGGMNPNTNRKVPK